MISDVTTPIKVRVSPVYYVVSAWETNSIICYFKGRTEILHKGLTAKEAKELCDMLNQYSRNEV